MPIIVIQHAVSNFQSWKRAFESDPVGRKQGGVIRHAIYCSVDDPNYVVVHLEFSSLDQAQKFLQTLRRLWQAVGDKMSFGAGGVEARIVDEVESVDY